MKASRLFFLAAFVASIIGLCCFPEAASPAPVQSQLRPDERPPDALRTAVFYYPWYQNPTIDGAWFHWDNLTGGAPPEDIASDYYPLLGAYSVFDPAVFDQHCAWIEKRGIRVLIVSWWGPDSKEDRAIPTLLGAAAKHGVYVAFHIEPYHRRSAETLPADIAYIHERYGTHPAFFRTTARALYGKPGASRGVFFLFSPAFDHVNGTMVTPAYWRRANDRIHAAGNGAVMIADDLDAASVREGGFDGQYSYINLTVPRWKGVLFVRAYRHVNSKPNPFAWGNGVPPGAWFIPSVMPGESARRIGYDPEIDVPRQYGWTFRYQWEEVLAGAVEPAMVAITSFNEWHEGTQIEPARDKGFPAGPRTYQSYRPLAPTAYLDLAGEYAARFRTRRWPIPARARVEVTTTSDWTTVRLTSGATAIRPAVVQQIGEFIRCTYDGATIHLMQSIDRANAGNTVGIVLDLGLIAEASAENAVFEIERGHIGATRLRITGTDPSGRPFQHYYVWDQIVAGSNIGIFNMPLWDSAP